MRGGLSGEVGESRGGGWFGGAAVLAAEAPVSRTGTRLLGIERAVKHPAPVLERDNAVAVAPLVEEQRLDGRHLL